MVTFIRRADSFKASAPNPSTMKRFGVMMLRNGITLAGCARGRGRYRLGKRIREQQAHLRPFGGGASLCPGRHFAQQEIFITVAVLATAYEFDLRGPLLALDFDFYGLGAMPVKGGCPIGIRRKKGI